MENPLNHPNFKLGGLVAGDRVYLTESDRLIEIDPSNPEGYIERKWAESIEGPLYRVKA